MEEEARYSWTSPKSLATPIGLVASCELRVARCNDEQKIDGGFGGAVNREHFVSIFVNVA